MKTRTLKLATLFAGIFAIGTLTVGVILFAIHQYAGVKTLRSHIARRVPSETAKLSIARKESSSVSPTGSKSSTDITPTGLSVKKQQPTENSLEPQKDSSKDTLYYLIATNIRNDFPELELSDEEIKELSQIILKLRESIQGFRDFDYVENNFTDFRQLENQRDDALWEFERITGMSVVEFLNRAPSEGGIDNAESDREKSMLESHLYSDQP